MQIREDSLISDKTIYTYDLLIFNDTNSREKKTITAETHGLHG